MLTAFFLLALAVGQPPHAEQPGRLPRPPRETWRWLPYVAADGSTRYAFGWTEGPNTCWLPSEQPPPRSEDHPAAPPAVAAAAQPSTVAARHDPNASTSTSEALANGVLIQGALKGQAEARFETNDPNFNPSAELDKPPDEQAAGIACAAVGVLAVSTIAAAVCRRRPTR